MSETEGHVKTERGHTVTPETVAIVAGYGDTAADALEAIAQQLKAAHPNDVLLSAVTVYFTDAHFEAEVVVRTES